MKQRLQLLLAAALLLASSAPANVLAAGSAGGAFAAKKYNVLVENGIFEGYDDGSAGLGDPLPREQLAAVLSRLYTLQAAGYAGRYADVAPDRWSAGSIEAVTQAGLMEGDGDMFAPDEQMTYEQIAAVFVRGFHYHLEDVPRGAKLGKTNDWAVQLVATAISHGILVPRADYTVPASRGDLVESAYTAYLQLTREAGQTPPGAVTVTGTIALNANQIEVTFSDGGTQKYDAVLRPNQLTTVALRYKGTTHTVQALWDPNAADPAAGTGDGTGPQTEEESVDSLPETATLSAVTALTGTKVRVTFSEPLAAIDVTTFQIAEPSGRRLPVTGKMLEQDGRSVLLATGPQTPGTLYTLEVESMSKTFTGLPKDTIKPNVVSIAANPDASLTLTFTEPVDRLSAELTDHYTIAGLSVTKAELSPDGRTATLFTSKQIDNATYSLSAAGVTDLSGNLVAARALGFRGKADVTKPAYLAVLNANERLVTALFSERLDPQSVGNIANYSADNGLAIESAALGADGKSIDLTVSRQQRGVTYALTIEKISDLNGNVMDKRKALFVGNNDTSKPTIVSAFAKPDGSVHVLFSRKLSKDTAERPENYTITNDLSVTRALLSTDGTTVTLWTTKQKQGIVYSLTATGIADLFDNEIGQQTGVLFAGNPDETPPVIVSAKQTYTTIALTFSEKLDRADAENPANYQFEGKPDLPVGVKYNDRAKTVTLQTGEQQAGQSYRLSVRNVKDMAGNAATGLTYPLTGIQELVLDGAAVVGVNAVELHFTRPVGELELQQMRVTLLQANGTDWNVPNTLAVMSDRSVVRVRLNGAPTLLRDGQLYKLKVSGPVDLRIKDEANVQAFVASSSEVPAPYVTAVLPGPNATLRVLFSEPVKNVNAAAFLLQDGVGTPIPILADQLGDPARAVTEATLYMRDPLADGQLYKLRFASGMTDATGTVPLKTTENGQPYSVLFGGVRFQNDAPRMVAAGASDKLTFTVYFSEPVNGAETGIYTMRNERTGAVITVAGGTNATLVASADHTSVTAYLYSGGPDSLTSGDAYKVQYNPASGIIRDKSGTAFDTAAGSGEALLIGAGGDNAAPQLEAVETTGNQLVATFSEPVTIAGPAASLFTITVGGQTVTPLAAAARGSSVTLTLPAWQPGQVGEISLSPVGLGSVRDNNRQLAKQSRLSFTTR